MRTGGREYTSTDNIIVMLYKNQWKNIIKNKTANENENNKIKMMSCKECDVSPTG